MREAAMKLMPAFAEFDDRAYDIVESAMAEFKANKCIERASKFKRALAAYQAAMDAATELMKIAIE